jgi:hypothetical protein
MNQQIQRSPETGGDLSRRDVLKGASAVGAGMVGAGAATDSAEGGAVTGGCLVADWPTEKKDRINISGSSPVEKGTIPESGDLIIYVHGLFSQDILDSININGANQAAALDQALSEQGVDTPLVAAMWDSTTLWGNAKDRAEGAGRTLATWLKDNHDAYDNITILAHSLGSRVTLEALTKLAEAGVSVDSAGLFGAGIEPEDPCTGWAEGIKHGVDDSVYNYTSEHDRIVCYAYAVLEFTSGLGCDGADCDTPGNFVEVDVSDQVNGHCNYYKPSTMDHLGTNAIPQVAEKQFGIENDNDTGGGGGGDDDDGLFGGGGPGFTLPAVGAALGGATLLSRYRDDSE